MMSNVGFGPSQVRNSLPAQYAQPYLQPPRVLQAGFSFWGGPTMPDIQLQDVSHRSFQSQATATFGNAPRLNPTKQTSQTSGGFRGRRRGGGGGGCGCGGF